MEAMGRVAGDGASSERTIMDKGKKVMEAELVQAIKSNQRADLGSEEGISVLCSSNNKEVSLFDMQLRKLEVSIFKGEVEENVDGWLNQVERYFIVNRLMEKDKLDAAVLCLEGEALDWYQWQNDQKKVESWAEFKQLLWKRFKLTDQGDKHARLMKLQQESSVRDYRQKFERFSAG